MPIEPHYRAAYDTWRASPSPENSDAILQALAPLVDQASHSYLGNKPSATLRGRAKLLTLEALERYDPERSSLRTHLLSHLRGLQRHAARANQIIRIPERVGLEIGQLKAAEAELGDRLGRDPSTAELADHTGLSPLRIASVRRAQPGLTESQTTMMTDEGEDTLSPAVLQSSRAPLHDLVHGDLHPSDQLIMEHTLGLYGRPILSKGQIARKLGLSPGAISQRAARIQHKIDVVSGSGML